MIHLTRLFRRTSHTPDVDGLDTNLFTDELEVSARREEVRRIQIENSESVMKEASPGMLK